MVAPQNLVAGFGGVPRNACVALITDDEILGVSEQERITRVGAAGFNPSGLPDEVLDELLRRHRLNRGAIRSYVAAEPVRSAADVHWVFLDHHFAHACAAFLPSPFENATIIVCDHDPPYVTVWDGSGATISQFDWSWAGAGFAELYSEYAKTLGFTTGPGEQRMEALARLRPDHRDDRVEKLFLLRENGLEMGDDWRARIVEWTRGDSLEHRSSMAAALQGRIGDLVLSFVHSVKQRRPASECLCLGGGLFHNSHFNSVLKLRGGFKDVFVPVNPGNAGLAIGTALHQSAKPRRRITPFLGPSYSPEEIKATLDNCKLTYKWASASETMAIAVEALLNGRLVAWFEGAMEWGARALGARSILASPFAPYALENLNRFLKQREVWRGYALSGPEAAIEEHFEGPARSPYMECDYVPKDRQMYHSILPGSGAAVRVQTVEPGGPTRFAGLLQQFGEAAGLPVVVNTSFNGFREPMVCSPRDAVRVFFGTGIDLLVLGDFVISK